MLIQFLLIPLNLLGLWNVVSGELNEVEVARVVQMLAEGHTQRYAAEQLGVSPSVINHAYTCKLVCMAEDHAKAADVSRPPSKIVICNCLLVGTARVQQDP